MSYLSVSDVDSTYKAALAAGAKSLVAPMDYGSAGRAATIADPTGGVFSLWRGNQGDPAEVETTPPGGFIWNELATKDEKMALAFYEKVFGFSHDEMPMPEGTYFVLKQGEKGRAGLYKAKDASMPTSWTPYVCVADCDATSERAKTLGATASCRRRHSRRRPPGDVRRPARRDGRDPEAGPDDGLTTPQQPATRSARALCAGRDPGLDQRAELGLRSRRGPRVPPGCQPQPTSESCAMCSWICASVLPPFRAGSLICCADLAERLALPRHRGGATCQSGCPGTPRGIEIRA